MTAYLVRYLVFWMTRILKTLDLKSDIKAIIFDFDGVILNSNFIKADAFKYIFRQADKTTLELILSHHLLNGGMNRYDKIVYYYKEYLKEELSESKYKELLKEFSTYIRKKMYQAEFIDGVKEFISMYVDKDLHIVSASEEKELMDIIKYKHLDKYFKNILGSPISKSENIKYLIKKYKYKPSEVIYIGDSINDYLASKESNILFLGI